MNKEYASLAISDLSPTVMGQRRNIPIYCSGEMMAAECEDLLLKLLTIKKDKEGDWVALVKRELPIFVKLKKVRCGMGGQELKVIAFDTDLGGLYPQCFECQQ